MTDSVWLVILISGFYYALPALRPSDRTSVRSKCSRHFSALFAAKVFFYLKLRISQFLSNASAFNSSSGSTATGVVTRSSNEMSLCESL